MDILLYKSVNESVCISKGKNPHVAVTKGQEHHLTVKNDIDDHVLLCGDYAAGAAVLSPQNLTHQFLNTNPYSITNDGVDGAIRIPQSNSIDFKDEFTFECDVKRPRLDVVDRIFWQRQTTPTGGGGFFGFHSDNTVRLTFFGVGDVVFTTVVDDLDWHHIAFTISDSSLVTLYLDKVAVETAQLSSSPKAASNSDLGLTCAITDNTLGVSYDLTIDNVRFWNVERTAAQISDNADVILEGNEAGLTAYYKCDENGTPANTLVDSVAANNGTLSGGMFYSDLVRFREEPVELSWDSVAGVDGYNVYLNKDAGGYVKQNGGLVTEIDYSLGELTEGSYQAYVTAVLGANESEPSNVEQFEIASPTSVFGLAWSGHGAYSIVNDEYIQFTAQGSNANRHFTCVGLGDLQDYEIYADFLDEGDADNNPRIFGIRVVIGGSDLRNFRYYPQLGANGDWVYVDPINIELQGTLNLASGQIVSMKFRKVGDTINFNCWIPSIQPEPDYGVGDYAHTEVITDEVGEVGVSSHYGFDNWRCTKFNVEIL